MTDEEPSPHIQDALELKRKRREEARKKSYMSGNDIDGRPRTADFGDEDRLLAALVKAHAK